MSYLTWSTNANLNITIDGVNIAEGCEPGNLNNAVRSVMAGVASLRDAVPSADGFMPVAGGVFSGTQPRYTGRGAYLHHNDSGNTSGRVFILAAGSPNPSDPANGDVVFFFA